MSLGLLNSPPEFLAYSSKALQHRGPETVYSVNDDDSQTSSFFIIRDIFDHSIINEGGKFSILIDPTNSKNRIPDTLDHDALGAIFLRLDNGKVVVQRSLDGSKPLYYQMNEGSILLATEKKALWAAGLRDVVSLQPGHQLVFDGRQVEITQFARQEEISIERTITRTQFIQMLSETLEHSFLRLRGLDKCGVLFSGGVDSSLAALFAKKNCDEIHLISVFVEGSHDSKVARVAADKLGLQIHELTINTRIVWDCLEDVIWAIETTNRLDVEIAIPFYLAGRVARELGLKTVVSGQGPDELFAGYARYVTVYEDQGAEVLEHQLIRDVSITHRANLERDEKAVGYNGVRTIFPYLDPNFVRVALSIPAELKINLDETPNRKIIFREFATMVGLDSELAMRPKRATQYSSGTKKVLLDAISDNIEDYRNYSRKRLEPAVQRILDKIGDEIGLRRNV